MGLLHLGRRALILDVAFLVFSMVDVLRCQIVKALAESVHHCIIWRHLQLSRVFDVEDPVDGVAEQRLQARHLIVSRIAAVDSVDDELDRSDVLGEDRIGEHPAN